MEQRGSIARPCDEIEQTPTRKEEDTFCRRALAVGRSHARRQRLDPEDGEDCAVEFVCRMLPVFRERGSSLTSHPNFPAWFASCAHNHARNFLRCRCRHSRPCLPLEAAEEAITPDHTAPVRNLEAKLGREEFWREVGNALAEMSDVSARMLLAYYQDEADVQALAAASGQTPQAIRKRLSRSRLRLRQLLEQHGWTEASLRDLIAGL